MCVNLNMSEMILNSENDFLYNFQDFFLNSNAKSLKKFMLLLKFLNLSNTYLFEIINIPINYNRYLVTLNRFHLLNENTWSIVLYI